MVIFLWTKFILVSFGLLFFGYKAAKTGYALSKITLFSETFMGMVFLAMSTSMPEIFISVSSAGVVGSADLALGNVFGTLVINLMVIVLINFQIKNSFWLKVDKQHILTCLLYIALSSIIIISIVFNKLLGLSYIFLGIGIENFFIVLSWIFALKILFKYERKKNNVIQPSDNSMVKKNKCHLWIFFIVYILIIAVLGFYISFLSDKIVKNSSFINHSYFGSIFLAISSSLPEIIVSVSSVLSGSVNMAIGNILGSNLFDLIIIPLSDIFYTSGPILGQISLIHIFTIVIAIILTCIVSLAIFFRSRKNIGRLSFSGFLMVLVFIIYYFILTIFNNIL